MSIPEQEFITTRFQIANIMEAMGYDWKEHYSSKYEFLKALGYQCFEHLNTTL